MARSQPAGLGEMVAGPTIVNTDAKYPKARLIEPATLVMLELWDYLAGWYQVETGLTNSVGLAPLNDQPSDYAIVNWARWDTNPLSHFWHQLTKRTFWNYVVANLELNHAVSMPIYCRLA